MVKLGVILILPCAIDFEAGTVYSLFLIFADFEPRCPYEIVLIKKSVYLISSCLSLTIKEVKYLSCNRDFTMKKNLI